MQKARRHTFPEGHSAPTACKRMVSGSHSSPNRGSSHLSVTILISLSVIREYLALRDGPRRFSPDSTWPDLLRYPSGDCQISRTGLSPSVVDLSKPFCYPAIFLLPCERPYNPAKETFAVWAISLSLAATEEIDFSFSSTGYLDVSVHRVGRLCLCIQHSLIREPRDQHSFDSSPKIFAVFHALHRRLTPRHPPCALNCLTT